MATLVFDTLQFSKKLISAGVPQRQAEVQAEAMAEIVEDKLASKAQLHKTEEILKSQQVKAKNDLEVKLENIKSDLALKMAELKTELTRWVIGVSVLQAGVIISCIKFLH
jgi:hypothetical protein